MRRSQPIPHNPDVRFITVIHTKKDRSCGLNGRAHSGINALPTLPPPDVCSALAHELQVGIPRSQMGRGAFSYGSLVKTIVRANLHHVDADIRRCHIQLRFKALPDGLRGSFPAYKAYIESTDDIVGMLRTSDPSMDVKTLVIALSNGSSLPPRPPGDVHGWDFLLTFKAETERMRAVFARIHPEVLAEFKDVVGGPLAFMSALDNHREAIQTDLVLELCMVRQWKFHANEWDGVVVFTESEEQSREVFAAIQDFMQGHGVDFTRKRLKTPVALATAKFPGLDWEQVNVVPSPVFMDAYHQCRVASSDSRSEVLCRQIDTVFSDLLRGRNDCSICKDGVDFQIFLNGCWEIGADSEALMQKIRQEFKEIFGIEKVDRDGNIVYKPPPPPLQESAFIAKVSTCFVKFMPNSEDLGPLDYNLWHKIQFADHMVYDFAAGRLRSALPTDRLLKTTNMPFQDWDAPSELKELVDKFSEKLFEFYKSGGTYLNPTDVVPTEDAMLGGLRVQLQYLFAQIVKAPQSVMVRGMMTILCSDLKTAARHIDEVIAELREDSRIAASQPALVGMIFYSGARLGGKSWLANARRMHFFGMDVMHYGKVIPGTFLTTPPRGDSEASNPLKNSFQGKKYIALKECPPDPILPVVLKGSLDANDGYLEARHNNSRQRERTSFPITWVFAAMSNTELKIKQSAGEDSGLQEKVRQVRTEYKLVDAVDLNDDRQRQADPMIATVTSAGGLNGEFFYWVKALYKTVLPPICLSRHLVPWPASAVAYEDEVFAVDPFEGGSIPQWMARSLKCCEPLEATPVADVKAALESTFGKVDSAMLSGVGLGKANQGQCRRSGHPNFYFYRIKDIKSGKFMPCRLKTAEEKAAEKSAAAT